MSTAGRTTEMASSYEKIEQEMKEICAEVLRRPVGKIRMNKSFLAQGGDSLLAIKLMARCGEAGYNITIHDMLQATSLKQLCESLMPAEEANIPPSDIRRDADPGKTGSHENNEPIMMALTPAQRLHVSTRAWDAKLFQLKGDIMESNVSNALQTLAKHHPILCAKLDEKKDDSGTWHLVMEGEGSFAYETKELRTGLEYPGLEWINNIEGGWKSKENPLVAALVLVQQGTCTARFLRLAIHRAVADASSWSIIERDLENALANPSEINARQSEKSFLNWIESRSGVQEFEWDFSTHGLQPLLESSDIAEANGQINNREQTEKGEDDGFQIIQSGPADFIIGALYMALQSLGITTRNSFTFGTVSDGRLEEDREPHAEVVGCFDTITRMAIQSYENDTDMQLLRRVKDTRMGFVPSSQGVIGVDGEEYAMIDLRKLQQQTRGKNTNMLETACYTELATLPSSCLMHVEPFWEQGGVRLGLRYNRQLLKETNVEQVPERFRACLERLVSEIRSSGMPATLSDFPLLHLTYTELDNLVSNQLGRITSDPSCDVEAIFPCTPRQEAFLVAQAVYPDMYQCSFVVRIESTTSNAPLDVTRLRLAWGQLVERHPALRTVFIDSPNRQDHFDQVVLKRGTSSVKYLDNGGEHAAQDLSSRRPVVFKNYQPTHQVTFCEISPYSLCLRLDMSHAVVDGQSAQVLLRDLAYIYDNQTLDSHLMKFHDFVIYQRERPTEPSMIYWSQYLAGAQPSFFPLNGAPVGREDLRTVRRQVKLNASALEEFCGKFQVTPANICQVAWALVLRSYTGLEDICFSYATSGRDVPLSGIHNTVGAFLNAVICRVQVRGTIPIPQAVVQVKNDYLEGLAHQTFTAMEIDTQNGDFNRLKGNTLMSCQRKAAQELEGSGLGFELIDAVNPNEYDLSINIQTSSTGLDIMIDYWQSRIRQTTVESVAESFEHGFVSILNGANGTLGEVDIVTPREIAQIREWGGDIPQGATYRIQDKVDEQRKRRPNALAVEGWDGNLTYQELDEEANKLAAHLCGLGVGPEIKVPICFNKSKWAVVSQLAILKAGGAVVPLGTNQPIKRTEIIIKDLQATIALTTESLAHKFTGLLENVVVVDELFMAELPHSPAPSCLATPENCAFVIYTSGSTGVPKGVVLPHSSLCTSLHHLGAKFNLGHDSRTVQFSAYTFDISIQDIYTTWHYGGCLIIISDDDRLHHLAEAMNRYRVTCAGLTSTVAGLISPEEVPSLKTLVLLGEAVKPAVVDQWINHVDVLNAYGPSECSMQASTNLLTPGCNALNIGFPFAGALWVVDPNDYNRLVPIGAPGELLIEGPIQARGYLNDPIKTSAAFVKDAAWMIKNGFGSGRRLYRTGDLVFQNPDGSITYIGRRDTQIKVRGQRVEVGEIEHHLMQQEAVLDAAILYPRQGPCQDRLVGLITLRDFFSGKGTTTDILPVAMEKLPVAKAAVSTACHDLTSHVPEHMLPKIWIPLESMMPQNDSSKLDRKRLGQWVEAIDPVLFEALISTDNTQYVSRDPKDIIESQLRDAWAAVLRLPLSQVPVEKKSFLALGGDSITAMHVVSWLRARGISLGVRNVLESKSIEELAPAVHAIASADTANEAFPLSKGQKTLFDLITEEGAPLRSGEHYQYNSSMRLVSYKFLEMSDIASAVRSIVSRHAMLRSRFQIDKSGSLCQSIAPDDEDSYAFETHEVRSRVEAEAVFATAEASLDLEQGPVFSVRFANIQSPGDEHQVLFLTAHRAVVDELSWKIIHNDMESLIRSKTFSSPEPFPFHVWVKRQIENSQSTSSESLPTTAEAVSLEIPSPTLEYWGLDNNLQCDEVMEAVTLEPGQTACLLGEFNDKFRTEPVEILLAALSESLNCAFPELQTPIILEKCHERDFIESDIDLSYTVGLFTSTRPLKIASDSSETPLDVLKRTKDIRRRLQGARPSTTSYSPEASSDKKAPQSHETIDVLFNFADSRDPNGDERNVFQPDDRLTMTSLSVGGSVRRPAIVIFDLTVKNDELRIELKFNRKMKYQERIKDLINLYVNKVCGLITGLMTAEPEFTLSDFPLMGMSQETLQMLQDTLLPESGIGLHEVEDIYPCSPIQQGILMSQVKSPSEYYIQQSFEILPNSSTTPISIDRIISAWQALVDRHPMLRTRFLPSISPTGERMFDQVVLKSCRAQVQHKICPEDDITDYLAIKGTLSDADVDKSIGHKLTLFTTPSKRTYAQIIVSHALVDASSLMLLQVELAQAYDGKIPLHSSGPLYSGYVSYLQQTPVEEAVQYWTTRLADAEPCRLPSLAPSQQHNSNSVPHHNRQPLQTVSRPIDFMADLTRFSEIHGVTMANIFQLGWALVLSKYTGSTDVSFGYLSSGRDVPVPGAHHMVGPLINMMVTHIKLDPALTVEDTVRQVQSQFLESFKYQRAPLIDIWHSLRLQGQSLFNTALSYRPIVSSEESQLGLNFKQLQGEDPTEYDITVSIFASEKKTSVSLQYSPEFLSERSANNLLDCLSTGIHSLVSNEALAINEIDILTHEDIKQVLQWNAQVPKVDVSTCIHEVVSRQRHLRPDATAVCAWDGNLTYQELDDRASELAHHLSDKLEVGPERMVALCLDKSKWAIIAQLAVLKAGGCVVSINPKHPIQRLAVILQDINASVMLTSEEYADRFADFVPHILCMNASLFTGLAGEAVALRQTVRPENAAFIIYTSGSTGTPKGVILTHSALWSSFQAHGKVYEMTPATRSLQFASYTFDASISDIWATITHGGCVCVISEEERMNYLQQVIEQYSATNAQLTPTVAGLLDIPSIKSLKILVLGGEAVKEAMVEEYAKAAGRVKVLNGYGPSECSIYTTCGAPLVDKRQASNIGRPLVGSVWVANDHAICPVGAVGELWIEGPLLARGYLNDDKKTNASFVQSPKWAKTVGLDGHRFYRTGDLVRQSLTGDIIYQARKDSQVKIRGQRVEVGEIEYRVKKSFPEAKGVMASLVMPGGNASSLLVAVIMELDDEPPRHPGSSESVQEILLPKSAHLQAAFNDLHSSLIDVLPSYMVPRLFIPVTRMPQTASGKLDRRLLRQMLESLPQEQLFQYSLSESTNVAPSTDMEKKLQSLWATVLNIDANRVGVQDHFLHLGGDSFTAMRLVSAASTAGIPMTVADVFRYPKLHEMAARINDQALMCQKEDEIPQFSLWGDANISQSDINAELGRLAGLCNISVDDIDDVYPCTPLQEGLMAITAQQPSAYIGRWVFRLSTTTDVQLFKLTWERLIRETPILRTRIVPGERSGALQIVVRQPLLWTEGQDLQSYLKEDLSQSCTYGSPLVRIALIQPVASTAYFVLTAHHSTYDGWSLSKIFDLMTNMYNDPNFKAAPSSVPKFIQYIEQQDHNAAKTFWESQLAGDVGPPFPALPRPLYRPKPSQKFTSKIDIGSGNTSGTLASLLRAAWALAVSAYNGSDVLFGVALSGRTAPVSGVLDLLAPTITTVPVHIHIDPDQPIHEYIAAVHQQTVDMIPFEHTGLQHIRRLIGHDVELPHLFAVQPAQERERIDNGNIFTLEPGLVPELDLNGYALTVECVTGLSGGSEVDVEVHFDENVIPVTHTHNLLSRFRHIFTRLSKLQDSQLSDRSVRVGEIGLLSEEEIAQIDAFNRDIPGIQQALVHDLVHQRAVSDPQAPAVCSWDGDLTHGQLDYLAEKLAQHLISLGVQCEDMVALCFDKSKWALVSNLAVLKAGAAVVPVRADPVQRVQAIIQDTGISVVLATPSYIPVFSPMVPHALAVDETLLSSLPETLSPVDPKVSPQNKAFVIYTSGSTGMPKGVVIEHGAMSTSMQAHGARFGMNPKTRAFNFAHFTFDISLHDIITTLQFGGCVCFPSEEDRVNDMAGAMRKMGVNYSFLPPRVIHTIKPSDVPQLKTVIVGGEAVQAEHLEPWLHGVRVFNAYGPAECSIISTCNEVADRSQTPNIGTALAGGLWVVDENDYNRLVPLGAVGELLIEGPLLARGYLNDEARTSKSFIKNPTWVSKLPCSTQSGDRRMYRTGDLVRQTANGSLLYVGRTDGQVKIRGQRVEIGEIEHHLTDHPLVVEAVAIYPRRGPSESQLVGVLTLHDFITSDVIEDMQSTAPAQLPSALGQASIVSQYLSGCVPEYMVPQVWVSLSSMPHNVSDKIDRRRLTQWLEGMDQDQFEQITRAPLDDAQAVASTTTEQNIRAVWAEVLQLPIERVPFDRPFLSVGGDSITAMQVVSRCRTLHGIDVAVRDVLQSKSIKQLSQKARIKEVHDQSLVPKDSPFSLLPAQTLYFESIAPHGLHVADENFFNQNVSLIFQRSIDPEVVGLALQGLVSKHSALRLRFRMEDGNFTQQVAASIEDSFHYGIHAVHDLEQAVSVAEGAQRSLDLENGPIFSAKFLSLTSDSRQFLFLTAHHLAVDLVSWNILVRDLEFLIHQPKSSWGISEAISFEQWATLQQQHVHAQGFVDALTPIYAPIESWTFWGLTTETNTYRHRVTKQLFLDQDKSARLLNENQPLNTRPDEVLIAVLFHSFQTVFPDRNPPTVFYEGHGRDAWANEIDLSATVGWFTTMNPITVTGDLDDPIDVLRQTKDTRRVLARTGLDYFSSRFLTQRGKDLFGSHREAEVLFNYSGRSRGYSSENKIFRLSKELDVPCIGRDVRRPAVFEVEALVQDDKIAVSFHFNDQMQKQSDVCRWIQAYENSLNEMISRLSITPTTYTMTDFPTLRMSFEEFQQLEKEVLPRIGIDDLSNVEDIYPCSPIQHGILLSQIKDSTTYQVRQTGKFLARDRGSKVDVKRLVHAIEVVVQRHAILRTIFVPVSSAEDLFYQIVLKGYSPNIPVLSCESTADFITTISSCGPPEYKQNQPPCQLSLYCTSQGEIYASFDVNHALMDASSMDLILNDIALAYDNMLPEGSAPSYGAYISFLQETSAGESLHYWTERLKGAQPCYFPPSPPPAGVGKSMSSVSAEVTELQSILRFRDTHGVTIANIMQLAWAIVLSRYIGSEDIIFGYLANGRDAPIDGVHQMAGPMINMMVTRVQVDESLSVVQAAKKVQDQFFDAFAHQRTSLGDIQHAFRLSEQGLFNTTMVYKRRPIIGKDENRTLDIEGLTADDPTEYNLQLKVMTDDEKISLDLEFSSIFIDSLTANHLLASFQTALDSIACDPVARIMDINVVPTSDIELLRGWNSAIQSTVPGCIHDKIYDYKTISPMSTAVHAWDGQLSYDELTRFSDQLAQHLYSLGIQEEIKVGLCFEKSMWTIVSMLAVLKCGGVVVPLGIQLPSQRLQLILEETGAPVVLAGAKHSSKFNTMPVQHILTIDETFFATQPSITCEDFRQPLLDSNSAAVVIYTSGSTGRPKGVVLTHGSVCTSIDSHGARLGLGPHTRALQYSAYVFDISLLDILSTLRFGGCVCVVSEEDRVDVESLTRTMETMMVNFAVLTPTVASLISPENVPSLSTLVLAGEAVQPASIEGWSSHVTIYNGYGPAECTILASANGPVTDKEKASSIGTALAGALWVVEPENYNRLVPLGVMGELLISGPLLAREYLNDPERTSQSFVTNPAFISTHGFDSWRDHRMYRTGDLVRQNPSDGSLIYIGRADGQIKLRGQRLEVGEIEYWVKHYLPEAQTVAADLISPKSDNGDISLAVAIEIPGDHLNEPSASFLALTEGLRTSFLQLQKSLNKSLPAYMVPSKYIPIRKMPLTASGKLDRRSLRSMLEQLSDEQLRQYGLSDASHEEPSTNTERQLSALWAEALHTTQKISANAHFFRVGGDSVTAMRLVSLARNTQPPIALTAADVFRNPVLSDMARLIDICVSPITDVNTNTVPFSLWHDSSKDTQSRISQIAQQCNVPPSSIEDIYPCTPLQEGLMTITAQHSQAYISRWAFSIGDEIDVQLLRNAWQQVFEHVPILRTRIVQDSISGGLQVVIKEPMSWNNVSSDLHSYVEQDASRSIGFGDRLMRFAIISGSAGRFFVWTAHHSAYDGWTAKRLLETVSSIYNNQASPSFLPFANFVRYLQAGTTQDAHRYWTLQLEGGMGPSFPETPKNYQPSPSQTICRRITAQTTSDQFTMSTLLRGAWALILSQETGSHAVTFATALSGRTAPVTGVLDILGPTITTVPVRISVNDAQNTVDYLSMIQQQSIGMIPFEHIGLHQIRQLAPDSSFVFQHLFVIQPSVDRQDKIPSTLQGLESVPLEAAEFHSYPLVIECSTGLENDSSFIDFEVQFDPKILPANKVRDLSERFEHVFTQLQRVAMGQADIIDHRICNINFVSPGDISRIQQWNRFDEKMTRADSCVHEIVYQQQLSQPNAPAVSAWDGNLSYRELDMFASQLAYHLSSLGVGPEINVMTIFEKTQWAVVTYLAVLKAGGTIVPVNHQHPNQRVQDIVNTTNATIILSSQDPQRFLGMAPHVFRVDQELFDKLSSPPGTWASNKVLPTSPAFIIFTSGSTGVPKGVVLEHGAIVSSIRAHGAHYATPSTRALQFSAFNFDISIAEIFTTLAFGGCICVISEEDRVSRLAEAMEEFAVNFTILTPTIANLIKPEEVPNLQKMLLVGEALRPEVARPWVSSHVELYNAYGPAECSILTTFSRRITDALQAPNIGLSLAHSNLWIVDPLNYHQLLPIGMIGELLIEGPLLARGYLGDSAKTADAFVTDPEWLQKFELGPISGRRFYRTGDLVQQLPDGSLLYIGRRDTQVKIHGQRVEIGEIEYWVKSKLPGAREVVAGLFKPDESSAEPILAIAIELSTISDTSADNSPSGLLENSDGLRELFSTLRQDLLDVLPVHMVPLLYMPFTKLPVTDSGKLNRRATWEIVQGCSSWSQYFLVDNMKVAPSTDTERLLQSLWATALKVPVESIGAKDDFFRSGGDSISAMRLVAAARDHANLSLKVADIFRYPMLSNMAMFVDQSGVHTPQTLDEYQPFSTLNFMDSSVEKSLTGLLSVPATTIIDAAPVTDLQALAITVSLRKSRDLMGYLRLDGNGQPNIARWKTSCVELVKQHDILRTAYVCYEGQLIQVVLQDYQPGITIFETDQPIEDFTKQLISEDMHRAPRLGQPFIEFSIISSRVESKHRILIRLSHAEYDAIALSYFLNNLQAIYQNEPLTAYRGFTRYMHSLGSQNMDSSRQYWRDLLKGSKMPSISPTKSRVLPARQIYHGTRRIPIMKELPANITLSTLVRAAWAYVLASHVGYPDVIFGEVVSGRNSGDFVAENTAGCCANMVPVRASFQDAWTVRDLLDSLQKQLISRLPHEGVGFRDIIRSCTDLPRGTFFTSMLNHLDQASEWGLDLEDGRYQVSLAKSEGAEDICEVSVTSTAGAGFVEIALAYLDYGISPQLADQLHDALCTTVNMFVNSSVDTKLAKISDNQPASSASSMQQTTSLFEGDLIDAGVMAFTLQKRGKQVTLDEVVKHGLKADSSE